MSTEEQQVIILLGPPGSGKGTQANHLKEALAVPHISTGDLFRENIKNKTPIGQEAESYMNAGKYVPDPVVLNMLFERVSQSDCKDGYLLDGFPRTLEQANALQKMLDPSATVRVINIQVADKTVIERISGRLSCPQCGTIYHKTFNPPTEEGVCDRCQTSLVQRKDDSESVVKERLQVYHKQTHPLINFYSDLGLLQSVNGELSPNAVTEEILALFNKNPF